METGESLSSLLDFPRKKLSDKLWAYTSEDSLPDLKDNIRELILTKARKHLDKEDLPLNGVMLYGGAASYQWRPGADVDVSVYTTWPQAVSEGQVHAAQERFKDVEIGFEGHPIHLFLKPPEESLNQIEVSDAVYDVLKDRWSIPPLVLPSGFDPDEYFKPIIKVAEKKAKHFDLKLGELKREVAILDKASQARKDARDILVVLERINKQKKVVRKLIEELAEDFFETRERRYALHRKLREKMVEDEDIGRFERFQEPEVTWKYLDRAGYVDILWKLYKLTKNNGLEEVLDSY